MKRVSAFLLIASCACGQVTYDRIVRAQAEPENWLTYSGNYQGHRYSPLRQITRENVGSLRPLWIYQIHDAGKKIETSPIVVDGVLYISERPPNVTALDGRTGRPLWSFRRPATADVPTCCGQVNRGVAILGDTVFIGTLDAHLIAL